ncbi:MAG: hypothetical protein ACPGVN_03855, partial [Alphaproteobacteria bacterium]
PDHVKRKQADVVVPTGLGRSVTYLALNKALTKLQKRTDISTLAFPNKSYRRRHKNFARVF